MRIYFDHNATHPGRPGRRPGDGARARRGLRQRLERAPLRAARQGACSTRRASPVAPLIGGEPSEIVFTSGGTESDNLALRGAAEALEPTGRRHLIASSIEHEAVLNTFKALARRGWRTTLLPVDATGIVAPAALAAASRRRHRARLGHARQQRDRHHPADRGARGDRARARRAVPHRRRAVGRRRFRSTSRRSASICCRSRRTSSTGRRAPARCGSSAARGWSRS